MTAFTKWRLTRRWFTDLSVHASGSGPEGMGGPGFGYEPGWISLRIDPRDPLNGTWWTISDRDDCKANCLVDAETWLWNNYAKNEVK